MNEPLEIKHLEERLVLHINAQNTLITALTESIKMLTVDVRKITEKLALEDGRNIPERMRTIENDVKTFYKYLYMMMGAFFILQPVMIILLQWLGSLITKSQTP